MKTYYLREFGCTDTIAVEASSLSQAYAIAIKLMDVPVYVGEKA